MKKNFVFAIVLAAAAAALVVCAHRVLSADAFSVGFSERTLWGDVSAAEGLTVTDKVNCDHHLFWDTRVYLGEEPSEKTEFSFSVSRINNVNKRDHRGMYIYPFLNSYHMGFSNGVTMEELIEQNKYGWSEERTLLPLWKAAAADTPAGQKKTFLYRLRDYYEYYPIQIWFDLGKIDGSDEEKNMPALQKFFRFPVNEEHMVYVTAEKNNDGSIMSLEVEGSYKGRACGAQLSGFSAVTPDACWYVFDNSGADGTVPLDMGMVPGGFGIYRIPYTLDQNGTAFVEGEGTRMVYSLNEGDAVLGLAANEGKLILFTQSGEAVRMSVIDPESFSLLQTLELLREPQVTYISNRVFFDDCLVVEFSNGRLALTRRGGDGVWSVVLTADTSVLYDTDYGVTGRGISRSWAWDGSRLACVEPVWGSVGSTDFVLTIYDASGLRYAGVFESTLGRDAPREGGLSIYNGQAPEDCTVAWRGAGTEE